MTDENTNHSPSTDASVPPVSNGHANGAAINETISVTSTPDTGEKSARVSKRERKRREREAAQKTEPRSESLAGSTTPEATENPEAEEQISPPQEVRATPETAAPIEPPGEKAHEPTIETPSAAAPIEPSADTLRLRMKIWTDPATSRRYVMTTAFMRDVVDGQPVTDRMYAYAMSDDDTRIVLLTAGEWNTLPFFYFREDGPAPRTAPRPADVISMQGRSP